MSYPKEFGRGQVDEPSLASILFVAVMFLTISAVNVYMHGDWNTSQAEASHQERASAGDIVRK